ncbi:hypothetical protein AAF712_005145 [Marasmius tenuissimus]|uniref:Mucoidy inhibitor A n=1 Tax=Marasmius tenuissimus TaxID=585030 RepID=A0ABR3A2F3_9AGAR
MSSRDPQTSHSETSKIIELVSAEKSKISQVNLYPNCAEVTRRYRLTLQKGRNVIKIRELPWAMEMESLRVEGTPTIRTVTIDKMLGYKSRTPALAAAQERKITVEKQLGRVTKTSEALDVYSRTFSYEHCNLGDFENVLKRIRTSGEKYDEEIVRLEQELRDLNEQIALHESASAGQIPLQASVSVVAESDGEFEIRLAYTVNHAKWTPTYDIYVNMNTPNAPVSLTYKALVTQNTGEDWSDVPLTLKTSSPAVEFDLPILESWPLSLQLAAPVQSPQPLSRKRRRESTDGTPARKSGTYDKRNAAYEEASDDEEENAGSENPHTAEEHINSDGLGESGGEALAFPEGNVSATFDVPGEVTISSNNAVQHTVIAEIKLDAKLTWASIPKGDPNALVKAQLRNTSEYTLLASSANIFIDGALHSKSEVPIVSPMNFFECSLGFDPSVRITYHPATKNTSTTGFYNKLRSYAHTQHISIQNAKRIPLRNLKIFDHIPVSENAHVSVKLICPPLKFPGSVVEFGKDRNIPSVKVTEGVTAQWAGSDEPNVDVRMLGKDGKVVWLCDVPAQGNVDLTLQWEVLTPPDAQVFGLY